MYIHGTANSISRPSTEIYRECIPRRWLGPKGKTLIRILMEGEVSLRLRHLTHAPNYQICLEFMESNFIDNKGLIFNLNQNQYFTVCFGSA